MARCLISFGANIGQSAETIGQAAEQLQAHLADGLLSFRISRLFRTPAVGGPRGQPPFINAVAALDVHRTTAWDVWRAVREVEHALGRVRIERWEARRIDLDVLMFEDERIWTQHFKLPHPRMAMRRFILEPALDVAGTWREPVSGLTIAQLASRLRSGPASIALVANDLSQAQALMERAAAKSRSSWLTPRVSHVEAVEVLASHNSAAHGSPEDVRVETPAAGRWLGVVPTRSLLELRSGSGAIEPSPKLVFVLADPVTAIGAAWEDVHRTLASWLGMSPKEPNDGSRWPLSGPRYLLASDDLAWAEHEIVAAMEAMDCPVEVAL